MLLVSDQELTQFSKENPNGESQIQILCEDPQIRALVEEDPSLVNDIFDTDFRVDFNQEEDLSYLNTVIEDDFAHDWDLQEH